MENLCRICLEPSFLLIDLKTCCYESQPELNYYELFVECTGIELKNTETSLICRVCKSLLRSAYELRLKAKKSSDYLRNKVIEFVEAKCEAILVEVKKEEISECEDYQPDEPASVTKEDEKYDVKTEIIDEKYNRKRKRPKKREKNKKKAKQAKLHWDFRCRYCLHLKNTIHLRIKCEKHHIQRNNGLECHFCGYQTLRRSRLENHIFSHLFQPDRFKCNECQTVCSTKPGLYQHRVNYHPKRNVTRSTFICQICGRELRTWTILKDHMSRFHQPDQENVRKFICDICEKRFVLHTEIKKHIETVHLNLRKYKCELCKLSYKRALNLRHHIEGKHQQDKKFICPICGKELKTSMSFYSHQITHKGEYKHRCTFEGCNSTFRYKGALQSHSLTHEPVQFHQCEFCPKRFRYASTLRVHKNLHIPGKMHKCKLCEKAYNIPFLLKEHEEVVHQGKRYECLTCGSGMSSKNNLRRHIRMHCTQGVKKRF